MDKPSNPYVEIRQNRCGQDRPYLIGTRVRVQDIVIDHERFGQSAEEIAQNLPHLTIAQVHGALAYFFEDREAIWRCVREDEESVERMRVAQNGPMTLPGSPAADAGSPTIPS